MNYFELAVGEQSYKLVLTTRAICDLEKKLGCNPLDILIAAASNKMPKYGEIVLIIHAAMQKYNHGVTLNDCYDIIDDYMAENSFTALVQSIMKIFEASGLIDKGTTEEAEKN